MKIHLPTAVLHGTLRLLDEEGSPLAPLLAQRSLASQAATRGGIRPGFAGGADLEISRDEVHSLVRLVGVVRGRSLSTAYYGTETIASLHAAWEKQAQQCNVTPPEGMRDADRSWHVADIINPGFAP